MTSRRAHDSSKNSVSFRIFYGELGQKFDVLDKVVLHTGERGHGIFEDRELSGERFLNEDHNQDGSLSNETFSIDICVISADYSSHFLLTPTSRSLGPPSLF